MTPHRPVTVLLEDSDLDESPPVVITSIAIHPTVHVTHTTRTDTDSTTASSSTGAGTVTGSSRMPTRNAWWLWLSTLLILMVCLVLSLDGPSITLLLVCPFRSKFSSFTFVANECRIQSSTRVKAARAAQARCQNWWNSVIIDDQTKWRTRRERVGHSSSISTSGSRSDSTPTPPIHIHLPSPLPWMTIRPLIWELIHERISTTNRLELEWASDQTTNLRGRWLGCHEVYEIERVLLSQNISMELNHDHVSSNATNYPTESPQPHQFNRTNQPTLKLRYSHLTRQMELLVHGQSTVAAFTCPPTNQNNHTVIKFIPELFYPRSFIMQSPSPIRVNHTTSLSHDFSHYLDELTSIDSHFNDVWSQTGLMCSNHEIAEAAIMATILDSSSNRFNGDEQWNEQLQRMQWKIDQSLTLASRLKSFMPIDPGSSHPSIPLLPELVPLWSSLCHQADQNQPWGWSPELGSQFYLLEQQHVVPNDWIEWMETLKIALAHRPNQMNEQRVSDTGPADTTNLLPIPDPSDTTRPPVAHTTIRNSDSNISPPTFSAWSKSRLLPHLPPICSLSPVTPASLRRCLANKRILFFGDSTIQELVLELIALIEWDNSPAAAAIPDSHRDQILINWLDICPHHLSAPTHRRISRTFNTARYPSPMLLAYNITIVQFWNGGRTTCDDMSPGMDLFEPWWQAQLYDFASHMCMRREEATIRLQQDMNGMNTTMQFYEHHNQLFLPGGALANERRSPSHDYSTLCHGYRELTTNERSVWTRDDYLGLFRTSPPIDLLIVNIGGRHQGSKDFPLGWRDLDSFDSNSTAANAFIQLQRLWYPIFSTMTKKVIYRDTTRYPGISYARHQNKLLQTLLTEFRHEHDQNELDQLIELGSMLGRSIDSNGDTLSTIHAIYSNITATLTPMMDRVRPPALIEWWETLEWDGYLTLLPHDGRHCSTRFNQDGGASARTSACLQSIQTFARLACQPQTNW